MIPNWLFGALCIIGALAVVLIMLLVVVYVGKIAQQRQPSQNLPNPTGVVGTARTHWAKVVFPLAVLFFIYFVLISFFPGIMAKYEGPLWWVLIAAVLIGAICAFVPNEKHRGHLIAPIVVLMVLSVLIYFASAVSRWSTQGYVPPTRQMAARNPCDGVLIKLEASNWKPLPPGIAACKGIPLVMRGRVKFDGPQGEMEIYAGETNQEIGNPKVVESAEPMTPDTIFYFMPSPANSNPDKVNWRCS